MRSRARFVPVLRLVRSVRPDIDDPERAIADRSLLVDGRIVTNPRALVRADARVVLQPPRRLRGEDKLRAALEVFGIDVRDRICVDLGASAGGFTRVLVERGARVVFAVDAGHGQLRGALPTHPRVKNLERTNVADLGRAIPRCRDVDVVTMDLSHLSVADAISQLEALRLARDADLVALVKPMFELGLARLPEDERTGATRSVMRRKAWTASEDGASSARCARPWRAPGGRSNASCTLVGRRLPR